MGRILLQFVVPILLPAAVYVAWLYAENRRLARAQAGEPQRWQDAPWLWLFVAGLALAAILSAGLALLGPSNVNGRYVPPQVIDGKIVPGHVEPGPAR